MKTGDVFLGTMNGESSYYMIVEDSELSLAIVDQETGKVYKPHPELKAIPQPLSEYYFNQLLPDGMTTNSRAICVSTAIATFAIKILKQYNEEAGKYLSNSIDIDLMIRAFELIVRENGAWDWRNLEELDTVHKGLDEFRTHFFSLWY